MQVLHIPFSWTKLLHTKLLNGTTPQYREGDPIPAMVNMVLVEYWRAIIANKIRDHTSENPTIKSCVCGYNIVLRYEVRFNIRDEI